MNTILSIDTSCDETSVAITSGLTVLSNVIASQVELHKEYGGVFPTVAKQAHKENIDKTIRLALKRAKLTIDQIDAIAVTQGPGLAPALEIGINKAKQLTQENNKPLIAVNHIEGHVLSPLAQRNSKTKSHKKRPVITAEAGMTLGKILSIIVSGGHTQFVKINKIGDYQILGHTIDDAAGEALDKVGRMLDLGYPAGPILEEFARLGNPKRFDFALPMTGSGDYNLSFSGLKTQARNLLEKLEAKTTLSKQDIYDFSASFQYATFRHICHKLNKILQEENFSQIWLGGGVAANTELRRMIRETISQHYNDQTRKGLNISKAKLMTPYDKKLCGDNAVMIGIVAYFKLQRNEVMADMETLDRKPRWEI